METKHAWNELIYNLVVVYSYYPFLNDVYLEQTELVSSKMNFIKTYSLLKAAKLRSIIVHLE